MNTKEVANTNIGIERRIINNIGKCNVEEKNFFNDNNKSEQSLYQTNCYLMSDVFRLILF